MKKFLVAMLVTVSALSVVVPEAQAKRMGSGGSIGKQSQTVNRQATPPTQNPAANTAQPAAPAAAPQGVPAKPASPWKGILGGALLGLGLGALLSHFGLGGAMASIISTILMVALLAIAAVVIYRLVRRKTGNNSFSKGGFQPAYAGAGSSYTPDIGSRVEPTAAQPAALQTPSATAGSYASNVASGSGALGVPADFDTEAFLRHAKTYFIRLQAAWDKADVNDLREFTSPEMFAELKMQLQERGASPNHTDVVTLQAELLGMETVGNDYLASVKFSGMIKEAEQAPAEPFTEVWNLSKSINGQGGWVLAGIQQLS